MPKLDSTTESKSEQELRAPRLQCGLRPGLFALKKAGAIAPLCWLLAAAALLCLYFAARGRRACMDALSAHVSAPFRQAVSTLADCLPFSLAEAVCTVFVLGVLAFLADTAVRLVRRRPVRLLRRGAVLAAVLLWVYAGVCAFWGVEYYATPFQQKIALSAQPVSAAQLQTVTEYFAAKVNETADAVPRDAAGCFAADWRTVFAQSAGIYQNLEQEYPCLAGRVHRPKPAVYSEWMSLSGFTGYLFAFTGESTLNVACPAVFLPVTVAHEFAHQRGVAPEQEANFCAVRAGTTSGSAMYEYSAWLFGYLHLSNALYRADPAACYAVSDTLCESARRDLDRNNVYWADHDGTIKAVAQGQYGNFLQSNGQTLGMESYGACVDLLVAYYLPLCD